MADTAGWIPAHVDHRYTRQTIGRTRAHLARRAGSQRRDPFFAQFFLSRAGTGPDRTDARTAPGAVSDLRRSGRRPHTALSRWIHRAARAGSYRRMLRPRPAPGA